MTSLPHDTDTPPNAPKKSIEKDFLEMEYRYLREEVISTRTSCIHILTIGVTTIPVIIGTANKFDFDFAIYVSPIMVTIFALMLLYEQNSLMRVGAYISKNIEENFMPRPHREILGWEHFIEEGNNRTAEMFFAWAAYLTFALYYIGAASLAMWLLNYRHNTAEQIKVGAATHTAVKLAEESMTPKLLEFYQSVPHGIIFIIAVFYSAIFLYVVSVVVINFPTGTTSYIKRRIGKAEHRR